MPSSSLIKGMGLVGYRTWCYPYEVGWLMEWSRALIRGEIDLDKFTAVIAVAELEHAGYLNLLNEGFRPADAFTKSIDLAASVTDSDAGAEEGAPKLPS